jgi:hypothetical protein
MAILQRRWGNFADYLRDLILLAIERRRVLAQMEIKEALYASS